MNNPSNSYITHRGATRILKFLEANPKQSWDVKSISEKCKIKKSCCYVYLARMEKQKRIERISSGFYRYRDFSSLKMVSQKIPVFHNLVLIKELEKGDSLPLPGASNSPNSLTNILELDRRKIEIRQNKSSVELRISATNNPLTPEELEVVLDLLGKIYNLGEKKSWKLVNFDMNVDVQNVRLDGIKCFTYQDCKELLYKAYNKGNNL